jgi:peptidoglycan biosynthesis protein MviN/MurJ (putative lipid II flippase)
MPLALAAALTVAVELPVLFALGYRSRPFLVVAALANVATNLALNLTLAVLGRPAAAVLAGEIAVCAIEWACLRLVCRDGGPAPVRSRSALRLGLAVLAANALAYALGMAVW